MCAAERASHGPRCYALEPQCPKVKWSTTKSIRPYLILHRHDLEVRLPLAPSFLTWQVEQLGKCASGELPPLDDRTSFFTTVRRGRKAPKPPIGSLGVPVTNRRNCRLRVGSNPDMTCASHWTLEEHDGGVQGGEALGIMSTVSVHAISCGIVLANVKVRFAALSTIHLSVLAENSGNH